MSVQELTQGRAHRDLVEARLEDPSRHAEQTSAGRVLRAGRGERSAAFGDDVEHVDQRLHVVFERRLPEQADLDGERRLVPRLSPLPLDGVEECGLLAADVGAGTTPHLDVDAEQASVAGLCDRVLDPARGTLKTYLFAIARNLTLKHYRDTRDEELPEGWRMG